MGGSITVDSNLGLGSEFTVTLAMTPVDPEKLVIDPTINHLNSLNVLLICGQKLISEMLEEQITRLGGNVTTVSSEENLTTTLEQRAPQVVLIVSNTTANEHIFHYIISQHREKITHRHAFNGTGSSIQHHAVPQRD